MSGGDELLEVLLCQQDTGLQACLTPCRRVVDLLAERALLLVRNVEDRIAPAK